MEHKFYFNVKFSILLLFCAKYSTKKKNICIDNGIIITNERNSFFFFYVLVYTLNMYLLLCIHILILSKLWAFIETDKPMKLKTKQIIGLFWIHLFLIWLYINLGMATGRGGGGDCFTVFIPTSKTIPIPA